MQYQQTCNLVNNNFQSWESKNKEWAMNELLMNKQMKSFI